MTTHGLFLALLLGTSPSVVHSQAHSHTHRTEPSHGDGAPLAIDLTYTADIWGAASGGVERGVRYLDNLDVVAEVNLDRLFGWQGATALIYGLYNNGKSISSLVGDAQSVSNIESGVQAIRLYEAWLNQEFAPGASLRVGLYDLNSEFDALDSAELFISGAHGMGSDIGQSGANGPSIFPVTSLAARLAIDLDNRWTLRAAVLDAVPGDPSRPGRTTVMLGDGALLVTEAERRVDDGKILVGYWRYTSRVDTFAGGRGSGNDGFYVRGEVHLLHESGDPEQGLAGFVRLGVADPHYNMFDRFASVGLTYTGLLPDRHEDQFGIALVTAFVGDPADRASSAERAETGFELTYRARIADRLTIQPDLQYIINPGADPALDDAVAIGLRIELSWSSR